MVTAPGTTAPDLVAALARAGVHDVGASDLDRSLYAADASLYRVLPQMVVRPRHTDELEAVLAVARSTRTPLTMRGAGTSIAGNAVGPGIVVDTSRHLTRIRSFDPDAGLASSSPASCTQRSRRKPWPRAGASGPTPRPTRAARSAAWSATTRAARGRWATDVRVTTSRRSTCCGARGSGSGWCPGWVTGSRGGWRRWPRRTSATCGPVSDSSPVRSVATRWSTCCPSDCGRSGSSWAARGRWRWSSRRRSGSCATHRCATS